MKASEKIARAIRDAGGTIAFAIFMGFIYMSCMQMCAAGIHH